MRHTPSHGRYSELEPFCVRSHKTLSVAAISRSSVRKEPLMTSLRRRLAWLSVLGAGCIVLLMGVRAIAYASDPGPTQTGVLCGGSNSLVYRFKPSSCDFHDRRFEMGSQVGYTLTRRLRWLHWGRRTATASGEVEYPMEGWYRVHIRLTDPRAKCGRRAFARARFRVPRSAPGGFTVPLDECP